MVFDSDAQALACCRWWQRVLRLQDWDVSVRIVSSAAMKTLDRVGQITEFAAKKLACIDLLNAADYASGADFCSPEQDHEKTLVHELLHLHTLDWPGKDDTGGATNAEEVCVDTLARALVEMKRKNDGLQRENQADEAESDSAGGRENGRSER